MKNNPPYKKSGFTILELTFVLMTLLSLAAATVGVMNVYTRHKQGSEAGQKLQAVKVMLRSYNVLRLPIDAADPKFGTGVTIIEKVNAGESLSGVPGANLDHPNSVPALVTYMTLKQAGSTSTLGGVYANSTSGGLAGEKLITQINHQRTTYYMRIVNGAPRFTRQGSMTVYDPTKTNDGMWDPGY
jgi:type II secretory pathway pseudopilin PulG